MKRLRGSAAEVHGTVKGLSREGPCTAKSAAAWLLLMESHPYAVFRGLTVYAQEPKTASGAGVLRFSCIPAVHVHAYFLGVASRRISR